MPKATCELLARSVVQVMVAAVSVGATRIFVITGAVVDAVVLAVLVVRKLSSPEVVVALLVADITS